MKDIVFKVIPHGSSEYKDAVALREDILRKPLGLMFSAEELEKEKTHIHIVGMMDGEVVATAVLVGEQKGESPPTFKMQRVAVREDLQSSGIGSQMMTFCEDYARSLGAETLYCHARLTAVNFYLQNDYVPEENTFNEDGIPHLKMRKIIAFELSQSTPEEQTFLDHRLGDYNTEQVPSTQEYHTIPLHYCFKENGIVIAGINAELYLWRILYISILFVDKAHRHKNLGSYLLKKVEEEAKAMGAKLAHTDTYDFQAKDFYLKHGYEIFGVLDDCPQGHKRYYVKKRL